MHTISSSRSLKLLAGVFSAFLIGSCPAIAEGDDPLERLIHLLSFEAEDPMLDISQASVSDCRLQLETLRRTSDRTIVSTTTTVDLEDLYGNNSWFYLIPGHEDEGARWSISITGDEAKTTYRLDQPSNSSRWNFRDRFGQRCWGDSCQIEYTPETLDLRIQSSTPSDRAELVSTFEAVAGKCYSQAHNLGDSNN